MALNLGNLLQYVRGKLDDDDGLFQKGKLVLPTRQQVANTRIGQTTVGKLGQQFKPKTFLNTFRQGVTGGVKTTQGPMSIGQLTRSTFGNGLGSSSVAALADMASMPAQGVLNDIPGGIKDYRQGKKFQGTIRIGQGALKTALLGANPLMAATYRLFPATYGAINAKLKGGNVKKEAARAITDFAGPSYLAKGTNLGKYIGPKTKTGKALDTAELLAGMFLNKGVDDIAIRSAKGIAKNLLGRNPTMGMSSSRFDMAVEKWKNGKTIKEISEGRDDIIRVAKNLLDPKAVKVTIKRKGLDGLIDIVQSKVRVAEDNPYLNKRFGIGLVGEGQTKKVAQAPLDDVSTIKIKPKQNYTSIKIKDDPTKPLKELMIEPRVQLKELGYPTKVINQLNAKQQWAVVNDGLDYKTYKNDKFIRGLTLDKTKQKPIKIKPKAEPEYINIGKGGKGDEAAVKAEFYKKDFDRDFAEWVGKRDVANTTGIEVGTRYKNVPKGVSTEQIIKYIEDPKTYKATPEVKKYAKDLRKEYNALYKSAKEAGIDMAYVKNYLTHIWDKPANEVQQMYRSMGRKFGFSKDRVFPTYEEGIKMGLKPKYNSPAQIIADYVSRLEKVKANIEFAKTLKEQGFIVPKRIPGFEPITAPGFMSKTVKLGDGTIREGMYYAPPEIVREINKVFSEQTSPKILNTSAKMSGALQDITLSGGVPKTPLNAWTFAQTLKEVASGRIRAPIKALWTALSGRGTQKYITENAQFIKEQQLNNISVRSNYDISSLENKGIISEYLGKNVGDAWNKTVNEPTFKRFMPVLQTEFYKDVRKAAISAGKNEAEAIKIASQATKNWYGLTGTDALIKRSKTGQDLISTFLFAPRYRESMVNFWVNNLKALKNPLALENRANIRFLVGATVMLAAYEGLNRHFNNGRSLLDNPPGTEDKLLIPVGDGRYIGVPFLSSIATIPRALFREGKMLLAGDVSGAARDALQSYSSMGIKPVTDVLANQTYFGEPIVEDNMTSKEKFSAQGKYLFNQYVLAHPYIKEVFDKSNQDDPAYQRLSRAMELPFRFYTEQQLQGKYYYGARDTALKGLSNAERTAFDAIPKYDSDDPNTTMFKYQTYLTYPKVFQAKQQTELELAEKTGKDIDPLYLVDYDTAKQYMRYQTLPPGSKDRSAMIKAYPELEALFELRSQYFADNPIPGTSGSKKPIPSKYVQEQMDAKNWGDPEVRAYLDANRAYQNEMREKLGLPPLDTYSWGSKGDSNKKISIKKTSTSLPKIRLSSSNAKLPKVKINAPPKILAERPQRKKYNLAALTADLPKKIKLTKTKRLGIVRPSTIRLG